MIRATPQPSAAQIAGINLCAVEVVKLLRKKRKK
uniref:Uncharacterized protein n=1 Tax=Arundo donax TaxID=35708 RepID=A0A0A9HEH8_ARUDO